MGFLGKLFGSGVIGSVERVASEWIETNQEQAEAKALMVKTLDPNGSMRRDLSKFACIAYAFFLVVTSLLVLIHAFNLGDAAQSQQAIDAMKDLFLPITTAWGGIVGASFGVNGINANKQQ